MRSFRVAVGLVLAIGFGVEVTSAVAQDRCAPALNPALMTISKSGRQSNFQDSYKAWQCSFSFSNHDAALSAGLSVGMVVYGLPLRIGGNWDSRTIDTWKNENCSMSARSMSFSDATSSYLAQAAPEAFSNWAKCVEAVYGRNALLCEMTGPKTFSVRWLRGAAEADSAKPVTTRMTVNNGTCDRIISPGTPISDAGEGAICEATPGKDLTIMVQTNRGLCAAIEKYPLKIVTLSGHIVLDSARTILADVVVVAPGAVVVTNGEQLAIQAQELQIQGDAKIVSFEPRPNRPAGEPGRNAGSIVIHVDKVSGAGLVIDAVGEDGAAGARGEDGSKGPKGQHGYGGIRKGVLQKCVEQAGAGNGGQGGPGGKGGSGGRAGDGGTVTIHLGNEISAAELNPISVVVGSDGRIPSGKPGNGGDGGNGGPGGEGGDLAGPRSIGCSGVGPGGSGPSGVSGPKGDVGPTGRLGSLIRF